MTERTIKVIAAQQAIRDQLPGYLTNAITRERTYCGGLSPRQVATAWVNGLKAARVGARVAKVYRNGMWQTLPLVLQFNCLNEHVDDSRERFAKVVLLVNPYSGWVSLHEDSCRRCTQEEIESFLITCPRCADPDSDHDEHEPLWLSEGDESPVAFVIETMASMLSGLTDEPIPEPDLPAWTRESAVEWLDKLVKEDGSYVVPPTIGQAAAWEAVREMSGHPAQSLIRDAQAARKSAATKPPEG